MKRNGEGAKKCPGGKQVGQQHHLALGKFQRIVMRSRDVLVDLPKDGRRVIEGTRFPTEQAVRPTTNGFGKGKLCPRKNANRRLGIFLRSKSDCTGIEVLRSQFLANSGRTGLYVLQAIVAHAKDLLGVASPTD